MDTDRKKQNRHMGTDRKKQNRHKGTDRKKQDRLHTERKKTDIGPNTEYMHEVKNYTDSKPSGTSH